MKSPVQEIAVVSGGDNTQSLYPHTTRSTSDLTRQVRGTPFVRYVTLQAYLGVM